MTTEDRPGIPGGHPEERGLVVRTEQTSLEAMADKPFLHEVGFGQAFLDRLRELNDVLKKIRPPIKSVGISLIPGETPLISTNIEHGSSGYRVFINSNGREATLTVETFEDISPGFGLFLDDIKNFIRSTFPNQNASLHVGRNPETLVEVKDENDFSRDLFTLSEEELKPLTKSIKVFDAERGLNLSLGRLYELTGEIRLNGENDPLFLIYFQDRRPFDAITEDDKTVILQIVRFFYKNRPQEIERVMKAVARLFNKPPISLVYTKNQEEDQNDII